MSVLSKWNLVLNPSGYRRRMHSKLLVDVGVGSWAGGAQGLGVIHSVKNMLTEQWLFKRYMQKCVIHSPILITLK